MAYKDPLSRSDQIIMILVHICVFTIYVCLVNFVFDDLLELGNRRTRRVVSTTVEQEKLEAQQQENETRTRTTSSRRFSR
ncbi:hypothetical protein TKK_0003950 [Trichogramma kaykai]